jgi:putative ABC transport system permease protein
MPIASPLLLRAFLRHLRRHPMQVGTTLAGVALGVAVSVAVDLANASATAAFDLSVAGVAGQSTHRIVGGPSLLDQRVYVALRRSGLRSARTSAPVVEGFVLVPAAGDRPARRLRLLGIDPMVDGALRSFAGSAGDTTFGDPGRLQEAGAVVLNGALATELGLKPGDTFEVETGGWHLKNEATPAAEPEPKTGGWHLKKKELRVVAVLGAGDERDALMADLLIADIATTQETLGQLGRLQRIDTRLAPGEEEALRALLPADAHLETVSDQRATLGEMTRAFRLNLTAMSWLALLVGLFLIYNTMTFAVVERRPLIGRLRAMGVEGGDLFRLILIESAVLGAVGTAVGLALGVVLAQALVGLVSQTISDLYFAVQVRSVALPWTSLARGAALGLVGAVLAALPAAREAASAPPRMVLLRSEAERGIRRALPRLLGAGALLLTLAAVLLALPSRNLVLAFGGLFAGVLGFAFLVPALTAGLAALAARPAAFVGGLVGRLAARGIATSLSRIGVAIAALVVAVAATLGVDLMVRNFRGTLISWLETTLQADYYLAASPPTGARGPGPRPLDPDLPALIAAWPGVDFLTTYRRVTIDSERGPVALQALGMERKAFATLTLREGDRETAWQAFAAGDGLLVSEPFTWRLRLGVGDTLSLQTDLGRRPFKIVGIFEDFATDRGYVVLHRRAYDAVFRDRTSQSLAFAVKDDADRAALRRSLDALLAARPYLHVTESREIKRLSLEIFDRTFAITRVLRYLAVGVAFLGIVSALMALQLERAREAAVLRALGLTPSQLWGLLVGQTGLLGLIAGLLAIPLGLGLAALLVHVINKRSFGWTLHLEITALPILGAVALAVVAALCAALYPAFRLARTPPAIALREE